MVHPGGIFGVAGVANVDPLGGLYAPHPVGDRGVAVLDPRRSGADRLDPLRQARLDAAHRYWQHPALLRLEDSERGRELH
jgi:hypothetical protein